MNEYQRGTTQDYIAFLLQYIYIYIYIYIYNPKKTQQAGIYLFKVNNGNTLAMNKIWSKLTIESLEQRQWRHSCVFIVNFEQIQYIALVVPLLTLNK